MRGGGEGLSRVIGRFFKPSGRIGNPSYLFFAARSLILAAMPHRVQSIPYHSASAQPIAPTIMRIPVQPIRLRTLGYVSQRPKGPNKRAMASKSALSSQTGHRTTGSGGATVVAGLVATRALRGEG